MSGRRFALLAAVLLWPAWLGAIGEPMLVDSEGAAASVALVQSGVPAPLWVDPSDWPGVLRATSNLAADIRKVTGAEPEIIHDSNGAELPSAVLIGTVGKSALIDRLVSNGILDVSNLAGRWESFVIETLTEPLPAAESALVIAGSDKRGTIYGIYELSEQIGVSPWSWWADVTPDQREEIWIKPGRYEQGEPSVRYRGIFLNDEYPSLDRWVRATYGEFPEPGNPEGTVAAFNSDFYARIFEVLLRLKGNTLWPAMWNNAFAEDDPDNARLADEYGIVMGTSHQEPMMRAQKEWDRHLGRKLGTWNYAEHPKELTEFWRQGVRERAAFENIYTIGLRGENDTEMIHGKAESIRLLEEIVAVQRRILAEEVDPDIARVPQVWTLYKEVQGYYESGLRVPDDVTLLWADDNWGNIRRLPTAEERTRPGGAGVYYHFDYHGGPRSYQWINTNPIPKIWEQMSLAKKYGADRLWIVNVGHFKGYELPTEYFLDLAWETGRWTHENLRDYLELWARREFGAEVARETAEILAGYTRINGRRKPELLSPATYSLVHFLEAETIVDEYNELVNRARAIHDRLPLHKRNAFYQLVLFPTLASAQVNELYVAAGRNQLYSQQGRASTNSWAGRVRELFRADQALMFHFNTELAGGKWSHFADQPHIGYTSWRDPPVDSLDAITLHEIEVPTEAALGVAAQGSRESWPNASGSTAALPVFDVFARQRQWLDVFNRGSEPLAFTASPTKPWILLSQTAGTIGPDSRLWIAIDWKLAPEGRSHAAVRISGAGEQVEISIVAFKPSQEHRPSVARFVESQGLVSIEAGHFTDRVDRGPRRWIEIEDYGHTLSGMRSVGPTDAGPAEPGRNSPTLEYDVHLFTPGEIEVELTVAPTLNFVPGRGLRIAVSLDDGPPQTVELVPGGYSAENGNVDWEQTVMDNSRRVRSTHLVRSPGPHLLQIWMIDPAIVVQKVVLRTPAALETDSYLGPPESFRAATAPDRAD